MGEDIAAFARGLSREAAARYVGVGVTLFDAMVADGRMPPPKIINSRRVWDRRRLDDYFEALPEVPGAEQVNPFDGLVV